MDTTKNTTLNISSKEYPLVLSFDTEEEGRDYYNDIIQEYRSQNPFYLS